MSLLHKLAIRNLKRNLRRTIITGAVMTIGLTGLVFVDGFLNGLVNTMIESATTTMLGDWQIHKASNITSAMTPDLNDVIIPSDSIEKELNLKSDQVTWSRRIVADGMASAAEFSAHVRIYGVNPEEENKVSRVLREVVEGSSLSLEMGDEFEVSIGAGLSKNLNIRVGDHLVIVTSAYDHGGMIQERFKIKGIFNTGSRNIDQNVVFMNQKTAEIFLKIPSKFYHEIAIHSLSPELRKMPEKFEINTTSAHLQTWKQLIPALDAGINITSFSRLVYSIILLILTALTLTNAILMSIYERMYEMGVLKAIGTRSQFIFRLIMTETVYLSFVSVVIGTLLGLILIYIFQEVGGVQFGKIEYFGASIKSGIVPLFHVRQYTLYPLFILISATVASVYPAFYAKKIEVLHAIRKDS